MEDYILIEKATHEGIEIGKRLSKESKPGGVGEWKEKYCKKFGLCDEGKKCQCKAELKFISNLLLQEKAKWKGEVMTLINREIAIAHTKDKGGKTSRLTSLAMKIDKL